MPAVLIKPEKKKAAKKRADYRREWGNKKSREDTSAARDIGDIPPVVNKRRKNRGRDNFQYFANTYFPELFTLAWSPDHIKVIHKIEQSVLQGGLFAVAMPRGSGKTTLTETACLWAILYGHSNFVCLIGGTERASCSMLDSLKVELELNELLLEDFPNACYPIHCLEGISKRCKGQTYRGDRTHIIWTNNNLVLPTIPGAESSAAIVRVAGLTGHIRGMKFKRPDGSQPRPTLVVLDDPQTDESARSPLQCKTRADIIAGAVLGMAGPGKKIAGIMPCTVVCRDDMADKILDHKKHPLWQGERTSMVYKWPDRMDLWEEYIKIRREDIVGGGTGTVATKFYKERREIMDAGSEIAWPARKNDDELSALQHAMNLRFRDDQGSERAFFAEYQNAPLEDEAIDTTLLTSDQVSEKINGYQRFEIPQSCNTIVAFVDIHKGLHYYMVTTFEENFTGYVIDYGAYPKQSGDYFSLTSAKIQLGDVHKGTGLEGSIYAGLETLTAEILGRSYLRDDGSQMRVDRCLDDANWGLSTKTVYEFCRQSSFAATLTPSHGQGIGASSKPMAEWARKRGERRGHNWVMPKSSGKRDVRHVVFDTNYWKSFLHARLGTPIADKGCMSLWKSSPGDHRMVGEHATAEYPITTQGRGRVVEEWKMKPNHFDNHLLDCWVGCCVAASMAGVSMVGAGDSKPVKKKRLKLSQLRARKR